ncbi:MFS transporter [Caballeronia sp. GAFFF1]|uniref:MFS transporter n=1 Tax=Caballeronia sp. GAFFF1 TaxID=2921779 RepID=UPI002027AE01|nr:MFS transporter [Caballeronia sp. GAFFF1]
MHKTRIATYENGLLAMLFLAFGFVFFDRLALSFLFPFIARDLGLTHGQLGLLSSVVALMWAISGASVGAYSDRTGRRKPVLILTVVLFSLLSALSGAVGGFMTLLLFRAMMGFAEGPVCPIAQSLMVEASTPSRRGLNMGLVQGSSAGLLGAVVGPPVIVGIALHYGWRDAFYVSCIPGLVLALALGRFVRPDTGSRAARDGSATHSATALSVVLGQRNILLCVLISCMFLSWFVILISFAPTFLIEVKHFSLATMSGVMSALGIGWVIWGFAVPALSDRIGRRRAMIIFSFVSALCPVAFLLCSNAVILSVAVVLTYAGLGCFSLFMATIPAETVPPHYVATALGTIMGVGELVGGFVAPTVAGFAADRFGLSVVMTISTAGAVTAGLLSLWLRETAPLVARKVDCPVDGVLASTPEELPAQLGN